MSNFIKNIVLLFSLILFSFNIHATITLNGASVTKADIEDDLANGIVTINQTNGLIINNTAPNVSFEVPANNFKVELFEGEGSLNITAGVGTSITDVRPVDSSPVFNIDTSKIGVKKGKLTFINNALITSDNDNKIISFQDDSTTLSGVTFDYAQSTAGSEMGIIDLNARSTTNQIAISDGTISQILTNNTGTTTVSLKGGTIEEYVINGISALSSKTQKINITGGVLNKLMINKNSSSDVTIDGGILGTVTIDAGASEQSIHNFIYKKGTIDGEIKADIQTGSIAFKLQTGNEFTPTQNIIGIDSFEISNNSTLTYTGAVDITSNSFLIGSGSTFNIGKELVVGAGGQITNNGIVNLEENIVGASLFSNVGTLNLKTDGKSIQATSFGNGGKIILEKNTSINSNNFTQSVGATLEYKIPELNANAPKLTIAGASNFNNSNLIVTVADNNVDLQAGDEFNVVESTGASAPQKVNFNITTNRTKLYFTGRIDGKIFKIKANVPTDYVALANASNKSIADTLAILSQTGSSDMKYVISQIETLPPGQINETLNQLSIESKTNYFSAIDHLMTTPLDLSLQRNSNSPTSVLTFYAYRGLPSGPKTVDNFDSKSVWMRIFGNYYDYVPDSEFNSYRAKSGGFVLGKDLFANQCNRFGFGFAYTRSNMSSKIPDLIKSDINNMQLFLYNSVLCNEVISSNSAVSFAVNQISAKRNINFAAISRTATSSYYGMAFAGAADLGYVIKYCNSYAKPFLAGSVAYINNNPYTESGADSLNLAVEKKDQTYLKLGGGLELAHEANFECGTLGGYLRYAGLYNFSGLEQNEIASFINTVPTFVTPTQELKRMENDFSVGLRYLASENIETTLSYSYIYRKYITSQTAYIEFRLVF